MSYIISGLGLVIVSEDGTRNISAVPGFPTQTSPSQAAGSSALYTDADIFYAPGIANLDRYLQAAFVTDTDTIYPTVAVPHLLPARVSDSDIVYAADIQRISGKPKQTLDAGKVTDSDAIFAPNVENIRLTLQPQGVVPADDAVYAFTTVLSAQPALVPADDVVPSADVGWRLFVNAPVTDADQVFGFAVHTYNGMLPETVFDGEDIASYPFFVHGVSGGIPMPERPHLTGSTSQPRRLTGSIRRQVHLTGSLSNTRRVLTGSIGPHYSNRKR
jgi:hypothetical protein